MPTRETREICAKKRNGLEVSSSRVAPCHARLGCLAHDSQATDEEDGERDTWVCLAHIAFCRLGTKAGETDTHEDVKSKKIGRF